MTFRSGSAAREHHIQTLVQGCGSAGRLHHPRPAQGLRHPPRAQRRDRAQADGVDGWKTIGEAQRYIEEANKIRLSDNAAAKMMLAEMRTNGEGQVSNPNLGLTLPEVSG